MISSGRITDRVAFETELLQFEADGASSAFLRQARAQVNYLESLDLPADLAPASDEALFHFQVVGEIGFALVAMDAIDAAVGNTDLDANSVY